MYMGVEISVGYHMRGEMMSVLSLKLRAISEITYLSHTCAFSWAKSDFIFKL